MEKFSYKFKNMLDVKKFVKENFQSDIYKYHVKLILQEKNDIFYTSLNSEIATTFNKFNENIDELYNNYLERYNTEVQIILGIELIIYIIKDDFNINELINKKKNMDISYYIIDNIDILKNKNSVKNVINDDIVNNEDSIITLSYSKIKTYINKCITLLKLCL